MAGPAQEEEAQVGRRPGAPRRRLLPWLGLSLGVLAVGAGGRLVLSSARSAGAGPAVVAAPVPDPDAPVRLFAGRLPGALAVAAPLALDPGRRREEAAWLGRVLGTEPDRRGWLYLHLFGLDARPGADAFRPTDRLRLRWPGGGEGEGRPVPPAAGRPDPAALLVLRSVSPGRPLRLDRESFARVLFAVDRPLRWEAIAEIVWVRGETRIRLRRVGLRRAQWEETLAGGTLPAALLDATRGR